MWLAFDRKWHVGFQTSPIEPDLATYYGYTIGYTSRGRKEAQ